MEVGESEPMGIVDDDGVGIGYVDAILHNCCGKQHVVIIINKAHNDFLQFFGFHLPMTDSHPAIRHILTNEFGQ